MFENIFDPFYLEKKRAMEEQAALTGPAGEPGVTGQTYGGMAPEERQSWLDRAYEDSLGGLSYVGKILDKTFGGRAVRGLLGGAPEELASIIPMSDTLGLTSSANEVSGRQLLDTAGLTTAGDDSWANTIAGVGTEMLLDPSTYMTFGAKTALGKTAELAGKQTKGLAAGIRAGERGLVGFGGPFMQPFESAVFGARKPAGIVEEMGDVGKYYKQADAAAAYGLGADATMDDIIKGAAGKGVSQLDIENYLDPFAAQKAAATAPAPSAVPNMPQAGETIEDIEARIMGGGDMRKAAGKGPGGVERRATDELNFTNPVKMTKDNAINTEDFKSLEKHGDNLFVHDVVNSAGDVVGELQLARQGDDLHVPLLAKNGVALGQGSKLKEGERFGFEQMMGLIGKILDANPDVKRVVQTPSVNRPGAGVERIYDRQQIADYLAKRKAREAGNAAGDVPPIKFSDDPKVNAPNPDIPGQTRQTLTPEQEKAVKRFSNFGSYTFNKGLRQGLHWLDPDSIEALNHLNAAADAAPILDKPITVFRGIDFKFIDDKAARQALTDNLERSLKTGEPIEFKEFQSSSTRPTGVSEGSDSRFDITVRKGIDAKPYSAKPDEWEMIIPPGNFRVTGKEGNVWKLEQIIEGGAGGVPPVGPGKGLATIGDKPPGTIAELLGMPRSFDTGFRKQTQQYSAPAADFVEGIPKAAGAVGRVPVTIGEYLGKPVEWATGVNPVSALFNAGKSAASGLGRALKTHFHTPTKGAVTEEIQPLASDIFTPNMAKYAKPFNEATADVLVDFDPLLKQSPQHERAVLEATRTASEIPANQIDLLARTKTRYDDTIADLGEQLTRGDIGDEAFAKGVRAAQGLRDDTLARLDQQEIWKTNKIASAIDASLFTPGQIETLKKGVDTITGIADDARRLTASKGLRSPGLTDDIIDYGMQRQLAPLPALEGEGAWKKIKTRAGMSSAAASDPGVIRREEILKGIPGGSTQVNEIMRDKTLRKLAIEDPDAAQSAIRALLTGKTDPPRNWPVWEQAEKLTDFIKHARPEYAEQGRDFFDLNILQASKVKGATAAKRAAHADTVLKAVTQTARKQEEFVAEGRASIPVRELMDKAGFEPGGSGYSKVMNALLGDVAINPGTNLMRTEDYAALVTPEMAKTIKPNKVKFSELNDFHVPEDVAADVMRLGEAWKSPAALAPVVEAWKMAMNVFKADVTAPFPAFNIRNLMSAFFNMWRDNSLDTSAIAAARAVQKGGYLPAEIAAKAYPGMSVEAATDAFKKAMIATDTAYTHSSRRATGEILGPDDKITSYGIPTTTGTVKTEREVLKGYASGFKPSAPEKAEGYSKLQQIFNPTLVEGGASTGDVNIAVKQGRRFGKASEDWIRSSHFLSKKMQGFTDDAASAGVKKYQIDYSDITPSERAIKGIVPWYGFSRGTLPPLLEDLATKPAKVAQTTRLVAGGREKDDFAPGYIAEGASLPFFGAPEGSARFLSSFGLPIEDEAFKTLGHAAHGDLQRTVGSLFGMVNPYMKVIPEQAFGKQFYSGRNLADLQPSPTVSLGGLIPQRTAQTLTQLIANTPAARVVSTADRAMDTRKWDGTGLMNLLTGMRVSDVDLERTKPAAQREWLQKELRPSAATKVQENLYVPPDLRGTMSETDQLLYDLLTGLNKQQSTAARERKAAAR